MSDPRLVDVRLVQHHQTQKAWLVSQTGDDDDADWLPMSQAERYDTTAEPEGGLTSYEFAMPEWLARKKGFL
jgi:hypothetical protein